MLSAACENLIYLKVQEAVFDSGSHQDVNATTVNAWQHVKKEDKKEQWPTTKWISPTNAFEYLNAFEPIATES